MNNDTLYQKLSTPGGYRGFHLAETHYIKELQCEAWLLTHSSGAETIYINSPDPEKTFSLSFRTIPTDDTGVFHILEHAIFLCGSKKYGVNHWAGDSLISSLYSGFTMRGTSMYPVSSTNEASFQELVKICADAVFSPLLTETDLSLKQEGWHYEYNPETDHLSRCGIVCSEMQASREMASFVLGNLQLRAAFPETSFAWNMGGDPAVIPDLTYDQFLDTYHKVFIPENCLLYIYGDTCLSQVLNTANDYLSRYEKKGVVFSVEGKPAPWSRNPAVGYYPVFSEQGESADAHKKDILGFNWVMKQNPEAVIYADILTVLIERRLRELLPESQISVCCHTDYYWPLACITVENTDCSKINFYREKIQSLLKNLAETGFEETEVQDAMTAYRFKRNEKITFVPEGIGFGIRATCGWAKGQKPWSLLEYHDVFTALQSSLTGDVLRDFLKQNFFENKLYSELILKGVPGLTERWKKDEIKQMEAIKNSMTKEQLEEIRRDCERLRAYQTNPNNPENIAALPRTRKEDLPDTAPIRYLEERETPAGMILFNSTASDVIQMTLHYSLEELTIEECSHLGMMALLIGKLPVGGRCAEEFQKCCRSVLSSLHTDAFAYSDKAADFLKFQIQADTFSETFEEAQRLLRDLTERTEFSHPYCVKQILREALTAYKTETPNVSNRVAACYSHSAAALEHMQGPIFWKHVEDILQQPDEAVTALCEQLEYIAKKVFSQSTLTIGLSCHEKIFDQIKDRFLFSSERCANIPWHTPLLSENEAFLIPGNMQTNAIGARISAPTGQLIAACLLAEDAATTTIRKIGGAYTVKLCLTQEKDLLCLSSRDPHLGQTINRFLQCPQAVANASDEEIQHAIIAAAAMFDKNSPAGLVGFISHNDYDDTAHNYFNGITPAIQQERWSQLIHADADEIRACAKILKEAFRQRHFCTAAAKEKAECNINLFNRITSI